MSGVDLERLVSEEPDDDGFYKDPTELSVKDALALAVTMTLDAAAVDPDLRYAIRPASELFEVLCTAEAAALGRPVEEMLFERRAQKPEGPRLLMAYREWARARAAEVKDEGELGSHWPGKEHHGSER